MLMRCHHGCLVGAGGAGGVGGGNVFWAVEVDGWMCREGGKEGRKEGEDHCLYEGDA